MLAALPPTQPGPYTVGGIAPLLRSNSQQYLLQQTRITAGTSSIAVQLERLKSAFYPFACSVQVYFTDVNGSPSAPGAFEVDVQVSDLDADAQYCLEQGLTAVNASQVGRVYLTVSWFKFLRVNVKTLTNPVYVTVLVTR